MFMPENSLFNPFTVSMMYFTKIITKTVKKYRKTEKYFEMRLEKGLNSNCEFTKFAMNET